MVFDVMTGTIFFFKKKVEGAGPAKRNGKFILSFLPLLFLILLSGCFMDDLCGNHVLSEAVSPNGKYKAVLFQRDCGATTDYSTQISILRKEEALPNRGANAFATDNTLEVRYHWQDDDHLAIEPDPGEKIYLAKEKVGVGFLGLKKIGVKYP